MVKPSDKRWAAYQRCVVAVRQSLEPLIQTFEHMYQDTGLPEAKGICILMKKFSFIATILMLCDILPIITRLSKLLQGKAMDVTLLQSELQACLNGLECNKLGIKYMEPTEELTELDAVSAEEREEGRKYVKDFLCETGLPYLEKLKANIERRFEDAIGIVSAGTIFQPENLPRDHQKLPSYGQEKLAVLLDFYGSQTSITFEGETVESPPDIDPEKAKTEWEAMKLLMASEFKDNTFQEMLLILLCKPAAKALYPNLLYLMQVCATLQVSTATTVERSFSDMKEIKTRLRSRLLPASLDHLMRIAIEGPKKLKDVDFERIADIWFMLKTNRCIKWIMHKS